MGFGLRVRGLRYHHSLPQRGGSLRERERERERERKRERERERERERKSEK